ncbi:MAG: DUF6495 family protein [Flavobacteriales bacterium]
MSYSIQYRLLTEEEKPLFYQDFIHFLSVHGISGEHWDEMKVSDPKKVMLLFAQFSDLVIHKSLVNIKQAYLKEDKSMSLMMFKENHVDIYTFFNNEISLEELLEQHIDFSEHQAIACPYPKGKREQFIFQKTSFESYVPFG